MTQTISPEAAKEDTVCMESRLAAAMKALVVGNSVTLHSKMKSSLGHLQKTLSAACACFVLTLATMIIVVSAFRPRELLSGDGNYVIRAV